METEKGQHIKTISGSTTNSMIDLTWNLIDEHGKKFNGATFNGVFHVTYPRDKAPGVPAKVKFFKVGQ